MTTPAATPAQRSREAARAAARRLAAAPLEPVAPGVWLLRGGVPRTMNAYVLQEDGGGVTLLDTGIRSMAGALRVAADALGGINRVVPSHAHVDHRGGAPALGLPVLVHPAERADAEGDDVAGFRVVHLPGHAPGQIGVFRERDGVALAGDCFLTLDAETTRKGPPRLRHPAFNHDDETARASLLKLAALAPQAAWCGHGDAVRGDVGAQLERAAG